MPARPDYGIDAPGVRRGMSAVGPAGIVVAGGAGFTASLPAGLRWAGLALGAVAAAYGLGMAAYMTWASRIGKLRTRERLLDGAGTLRAWRGDETVLDVGCGRGLMLVGAAHRLTTGIAIGIDPWRQQDQGANGPEAARRNALLEGVIDRVRIETGDARMLPIADASVDVVVSHWVVHNLPQPADRLRAWDEMWRVLKPGGVVVLADIAHVADGARHFGTLGAVGLQFDDGGRPARVMGALSGGTFRPQSLVAKRPAAGEAFIASNR